MASGRDVRDMLGLPAAGGDAPKTVGSAALAAQTQKRSKPAGGSRKIRTFGNSYVFPWEIVKRSRLTLIRPEGVAREVAALYGERPPPVAVYEEKKAYRAKRQSTGPAKKWIQQPFTNPARSDGLVLRHWRRKPTAAPPVQEADDATMHEGDAADSSDTYVESCSDYAKYDIKVDMPSFTDEEYDQFLRSDDWSREETDYLFEVVRDYSYRWPVIWDRYDYQPSRLHMPESADAGDQALATMPFAPSKKRSLEDLKARFYDISAKLMKQRIPEVSMDADQYSLYEMLTKFDPVMERNRKMLATALINRTMDEVKEEEFLLTELQRINMAANRLDAEREELRARLDAPPQNPQASAGLQAFTSSQALQALFQQLFQQDRSKKRAAGGGTGPGRLSLSANDMVHTPGSAQQQLSAANRRQSMAQNQQTPAQTPVKHLSPHQEHRFNVSTHDRLTSGVTFGSDKLLKMRQAKSNVQTQKISQMLAALGVSDIISIPTTKVGEVFEVLVTKVSKLLDVRKVREKEEGECKVLLAMKERRQANGNGGEEDEETKPKQEVPDSQDTPGGDADADGDNDDEDDVNKNYGDDAEGDDNAEDDAEGEEDESGFQGEDGDDGDVDAEGEDESSKQQSRATSHSASGQGHKRSASVFSQGSEMSSKRARK
ncbi:SWR1-complex protein 4 [Curvularia clavata]|uniref:SWR1-complex protein 4 n=1 Tax=Curvularia clavata TaxID=95742 RepID=A0A9Q9DRB5_CURCL|nr:SWR1-complex protein 4 [Curvularia clavata]